VQITKVGQKHRTWEAWVRWIELGARALLVLTNGAILYVLARILEAL